MATRETNGTGKRYYSIIDGTFRRKVDSGTEGAVQRTNKNGVEVNELCVGNLFGSLANIYVDDTDFGRFIKVELTDGDCLSIPLDSAIAKVFMKILPNIDLGKEVEFGTWKDDEGRNAFVVKQEGAGVKWAHTKDNPNGLPAPEEKTVAGKKKWDWSEQDNFLYEQMMKIVEKGNFATKASVEDFNDMSKKEDDLPF